MKEPSIPAGLVAAPPFPRVERWISGRVPLWAVAWFAAILCCALVLRLNYFTGWVGSDDVGYYSAADYVLQGQTILRLHHHYSRMTMVAPVAAALWALGEHSWVVILPTVIASIASLVCVVFLGRLIWGWWEGLLAATMLSALPYFLVLSTAAYPDVHTCLWSTAAWLFFWLARERPGRGVRHGLALMAGLCVYLAVSAKVLCAPVVLPLAWMIATHRNLPRRDKLQWLGAVLAGGGIGFLSEGVFYAICARDFLFNYHALAGGQAHPTYFPDQGYFQAPTWLGLAAYRLSMPWRGSSSGWGPVGWLFWPALLGVACFDRRGRMIAVWGLCAFLTVAFVPVHFDRGWQPFPTFDGRHLLVVSVPLVLCVARGLRMILSRAGLDRWLSWSWPALFIGIIAILLPCRHQVGGFRDRDTQRVGTAIVQWSEQGHFANDLSIFMTPSAYWRFRILFPEDVRERLYVAVDDASPEWWRTVTARIDERVRPLPKPGGGLLLATPTQLRGEPEHWDYGVTLPHDPVAAWREIRPTAAMKRARAEMAEWDNKTRDEFTVLLLGGERRSDHSIASTISEADSQSDAR